MDRGGWNRCDKHAETDRGSGRSPKLPWVLGESCPAPTSLSSAPYDSCGLQGSLPLPGMPTALTLTHCHRFRWVWDSCGPPGLQVWGLPPLQGPSVQRWGQMGSDRAGGAMCIHKSLGFHSISYCCTHRGQHPWEPHRLEAKGTHQFPKHGAQSSLLLPVAPGPVVPGAVSL